MKRTIFKNDEHEVTFKDTKKTRDAVFERVLEYFVKHESFCGESIMQSDDPIIFAPDVFADIADDILKFKDKWFDDDDN